MIVDAMLLLIGKNMPENPSTSLPRQLGEHTRVRVLADLPQFGLNKGELGTIVHVYEAGGYEVEFPGHLNRPVVITLDPEQVEPFPGSRQNAKGHFYHPNQARKQVHR
jgi:hypothetical protein